MKLLKPNFNFEWDEAQRYPEFKKMGKENWVEFAKSNFYITFYSKIKDVLGNVDLNFEKLEPLKKKRFINNFEKREVEMPIVVKFSNDDYDLLGGNTRLAGMVSKGLNPKLWVIDMTQKEEMNEKWSEKYKKSIDCNNPKGFSQRAHCQGKKKKMNETENLKGGLADNKTIESVAKKHKVDVDLLNVQLQNGIEHEKNEHVKNSKTAKEIALDHLWEDPQYYIKLKKIEKEDKKEVKETDASSSGGYAGPMFATIKKKDLQESILGTGEYDVPAFGKTPKGGRKNPLKIDGPDSIYKGRAVTDKKFPKWGGPDSVFVKIKEKCKKFPYCNQGDTGALEFIKEDVEFKEAITKASKMYGIPYEDVEKIVINEIVKIFI